MTSHVGIMLVFSACVSAVFGVLHRDTVREQVRMAGKVFGCLVLGAYALGWLLLIAFR
jgi:hypothetical protein